MKNPLPFHRRYALYSNTGHRKWHLIRECLWAVLALLCALWAYDSWIDSERLKQVVFQKEESVMRTQKILTGCLNGSYTGLYYHDSKDRRIDVVCSTAYVVREEI